MKIRIVEKGWAGFTGELGRSVFVDGISVDHVAPADIERIGSSVRIEEVQENIAVGEGTQLGPANQDLQAQNLRAEVAKTRAPRTPQIKDGNEPGAEPEKPFVQVPVDSAKIWSFEELEQLADARGIAGIREIATTLNLKGNSISKLIGAVMKAQGTPMPVAPVATPVLAPAVETVGDIQAE